MPVLVLTARFSGVPWGVELFIKLVFTLLPLALLLHVWSAILPKLLPGRKRGKADLQKRLRFLTGLQIAALSLFTAAALGEALGLYVLGKPEFAFTPFPATVVLILWYLFTVRQVESLERSGAVPEGVTMKLGLIRRLMHWVFAAYAAVLAVLILPGLLYKS